MDEVLIKSYEEQKDASLTLTKGANAADFRNYTTNFMIDVSKYIESLKQIPALIEKLTKNLENHDELMSEVREMRKETAELKTKVESLESEGRKKDEKIEKLTGELDSVKLDFNEKINKLTAQVEKNAKAALSLERHSRSFSLRMLNVPESTNEKFSESIEKVSDVLKEVTGRDNIQIEYGHRTGKPREDKSARPVIFRLMSRQDKMYLLTQRKKFHQAGYMIFEDIPKADLDEKQKHAEIMQEKYNAGRKVMFARGQWFVDGRAFTGEST